jgi:hypothetical protein
MNEGDEYMPTEAEEAAAFKKMKDEQHKNSIKHMEELNKILPTPSVAEMNKAAALVGVEVPKEPVPIEVEPVPAPAHVAKTSDATHSTEAGAYKTRDVKAKS